MSDEDDAEAARRRAVKIIEGLHAGVRHAKHERHLGAAGIWALGDGDALLLAETLRAGLAGDLAPFRALVGWTKKKDGTPGYSERFKRKRLTQWFKLCARGKTKEAAANELGTTARQIARDLNDVGDSMIVDGLARAARRQLVKDRTRR